MRKILLIVLLISALTPLQAQSDDGEIRGKILDSKSNDIISGAYIKLLKNGIEVEIVASDYDGNYYFKGLDPGTYNIIATATLYGYDTAKVLEVPVTSGEVTENNITMIKKDRTKTQTVKIIKFKDPMLKKDESSFRYSGGGRSINLLGNNSSTSSNGNKSTNTQSTYKKRRKIFQIAQTAGSTNSLVNRSTYDDIQENDFKKVLNSPLSTFSIDVDVASYADVRGSITRKQKPDPNAVRVEELINYFTYNLPNPSDETPFSITTQIGTCPWNSKHQLLQVAMKGKSIDTENLPANNLVFLLDVSGSMDSEDKLELIKKAFRLLVNELREQDKITIVVYAGSEGVVLPPTSGADKEKIMQSLENLQAGGSTAGSEGLVLAYKMAEKSFIKDGNNRIILATDGDFNVGIVGDDALIKLIEEKREKGVSLTVLGVGYDNYQSSKMEKLADNGNGNFAYLDNILEAKKVLVTEMGATLLTIAKDVKLQVEFNPAHIASYRLIGYENRILENKDFTDDAKDAGDMGSGHTIVAMYELIPVGAEELIDSIPLRYKTIEKSKTETQFNDELLMVKLRYKNPKEKKSQLLTVLVFNEQMNQVNEEFFFAASVAQFGMLMRGSKNCSGSYDDVIGLANKGISYDPGGYRSSYIQMVETVKLMGW